MFRLLGYLILALFGISLLRAVIGIVAKFFVSNTLGDNPGGAAARRQSAAPVAGVLQKDPVCGTFVPEQSAKRLQAGGTVHYFCSEECLKKFRETQS
jgi:YHS domain-containing protein